MARSCFFIIALIGLIGVHALINPSNIPRKQLAGPPSEFDNHKIPSPISAALLEDSAYIDVYLKAKQDDDSNEGQKLEWKTDLLIDSEEEFIVSLITPLRDDLKIKLRDPSGKKVHLEAHEFKGHFPIGESFVPEVSYRFEKPQTGTWKLKISKKLSPEQISNMTNSDSPNGAIILWNKSKTRLHSYLNTYNLRLNSKIGLVTSITEVSEIVKGVRPEALKDSVATAVMDIFLPDGTEVDVQLHDDGLHFDFEANDGIYGGSIDATESGVYRASAVVTGTTSSGLAFIRSTQHLIPVIVDEISLSGDASSSLKDKERLTISLGVVPDQQAIEYDKLYRTYAEVYGMDSSNNEVAICWISNLGNVEKINNQDIINLELNLKWLSLAKAHGPLTLKNVVIQETESFVPISELDQVIVSIPSQVSQYLAKLPFVVTEITKEMRQGLRTVLPNRSVNVTGKSGIVLLHGYCAGSNPFAQFPEDWTNAYYFSDPSANRNNNEYAAMVDEFANQNGLSSYSVVGHSQGGMVALHLLNYFQSGMDDATGGRLIQSIGTPYLGCSAAGSSANLGKAFGVGCGSNQDLATDGAQLWLAGITQESREQVYYYTTTYEQGKFFGDYCNMAINSILEWPNDGTSELQYTKLPNGKNQGNTEKQCHTTDMKYPAQYHDRSRNQQMNKLGAR